jgi:hypothetical protein
MYAIGSRKSSWYTVKTALGEEKKKKRKRERKKEEEEEEGGRADRKVAPAGSTCLPAGWQVIHSAFTPLSPLHATYLSIYT